MRKTPCRTCGTHRCAHKRGGRNRAKQFTREFQQAARSHVKRANLIQNGKKSFAIVASKYGQQWIAEQVAQWRREHPSSIEQIVMRWLDEISEPYAHEQPFMQYLAYPDFQLHARRIVIEVDGRGFHNETAWLGEDRADHDRMKDELYQREGYKVLRLCERCVRDGSGKQLLINFLEARDGLS